jgi:molybdate transport system substrate-binding protein
MFDKLGIKDAMKGKARQIPATPVGEIVAKGEAEIGLQQISELSAVKGVEMIGPLPKAIQSYTEYGAGVGVKAAEPAAAKALLAVFTGPAAAPVLQAKGMQPSGM